MTKHRITRNHFGVTEVQHLLCQGKLEKEELTRLLDEACHALHYERQKLDAARDGVAALAAGLGVRLEGSGNGR